jgi:hypothetical protein
MEYTMIEPICGAGFQKLNKKKSRLTASEANNGSIFRIKSKNTAE